MKQVNPICYLLLLLIVCATSGLQAQENKITSKQDVYVDGEGVMRWGHNEEEVKGFGVNYSAPFAHAFRTAKKLGIDIKEAIDNDVYHFSRLDFDLYRIHVWDTEISDEEGNLLENEQLAIFDYLLKQLKDRNINYVITPIAYWGNGWPEPDEETPGFSHKYGKDNSLTDSDAIKAQENYLAQFLQHVNPLTGVAYKDEPNLIAIEISNEPHHRGTPEEVTTFVKKMVNALRSTGTKKPIFYNVSHSVHLAEAYFEAGIQGGTFQWYPTGLGFQKELAGNLLPNVNEYKIPFDEVIKKNSGAKLVYEFDAADVNRSYIYPAMARSFREAGIQIATHFAYDPTYMAYANTEYNTHYMNLAYTPAKALALMISGKVFHKIPMNRDYGTYPQNLKFEDFEISYPQDLAILNSEEEFIYTNSNARSPKDISQLIKIAGTGNSQVVKYEGNGAYFLDKLEDGVWRLEVMPDAILVDNPFGRNNLDKTVAVINWKKWMMSLSLPDLGENFVVRSLNAGNNFKPEIKGNTFTIEPGTYLLTRKNVQTAYTGKEKWNQIRLNEFNAPETTVKQTYVIHEPVNELRAGEKPLEITAQIVSNDLVEKAEVWLQNGNRYHSIELRKKQGYTYSGLIPVDFLQPGFLKYRIIVSTRLGNFTYPGNIEGNPGEWDYFDSSNYTTRVVAENNPLYLFNAAEDHDYIVGKWQPGNKVVPGSLPGQAEYQVKVEQLFEKDEENLNALPVYDYSFRYNFSEKIKGRAGEISQYHNLVLKGRSLSGKPKKIQVAIVDKQGAAFGKVIELQPEEKEYIINLKDLAPVKTVTLPRPYPTFLQYYFEHENRNELNMEEAEALQISIGPGLEESELQLPQEIGITSLRLE